MKPDWPRSSKCAKQILTQALKKDGNLAKPITALPQVDAGIKDYSWESVTDHEFKRGNENAEKLKSVKTSASLLTASSLSSEAII
jgi:hypothetical protein